jgi:bifunctional non-homologous end joining protein LigD
MANDDIKVFTRNGNDWTKRFRKVAADAYLINAKSAIIDGEIVVPAADGTTDIFPSFRTNSRARPTRSSWSRSI